MSTGTQFCRVTPFASPPPFFACPSGASAGHMRRQRRLAMSAEGTCAEVGARLGRPEEERENLQVAVHCELDGVGGAPEKRLKVPGPGRAVVCGSPKLSAEVCSRGEVAWRQASSPATVLILGKREGARRTSSV